MPNDDRLEPNNRLEQAIQAIQAGDRKRGRALLAKTQSVPTTRQPCWMGLRAGFPFTTLAVRRRSNHLGSASAVVSVDGTAAQTQGYMPWGETRFGSLGTEYQFTGQYRLAALGLDYFNARWYDPMLGRFAQADSIVPEPNNPLAYDRYQYVYSNPIRFSDPSGYFSEDQIKEFLGLSKDDPWEEVLKLFGEGGKYARRWGWLETLRRAEVGDQITIGWAEGMLPEGHPALDGPLTFGLDPNGDLILSGDGFYVGHGIAGLYGENYHLSHYTDLSAFACSPMKCTYTANFSTSAVHDPYLHPNLKWEELANPFAVSHVAEPLGATIAVGTLTILSVRLVLLACLTPLSCAVGVVAIGPVVPAGSVATVFLARGTYQIFRNEFIEYQP